MIYFTRTLLIVLTLACFLLNTTTNRSVCVMRTADICRDCFHGAMERLRHWTLPARYWVFSRIGIAIWGSADYTLAIRSCSIQTELPNPSTMRERNSGRNG